ncbi:MAG: ABC transporter permease [Planctomycetales bacterium]
MNRILVIARREYLSMVATKGFLIGVLLVPVLMVGGGFVPRLLEKSVDLGDKTIVVLDQGGKTFDELQAAVQVRNEHATLDPKTGKQTSARYVLERGPSEAIDDALRLELSDRIRRRSIYAFVEIPENLAEPGAGPAAFYSESSALSDVRQWLEQNLNRIVRDGRFQSAGVAPEVVTLATTPVALDGRGLYARHTGGEIRAAEPINKMAAIFLPSGIMMLMFMVVYISFLPILECVLEEKQHRIAEVLLGSVNSLQLMTGKLLGNVAGSLTTITIYFAAAAAIAGYNGVLQQIPWRVVPWFIAFQILAVLLYSAVVMALAAAASNLQEAQGYLIFVWVPLMLPMFAWLNVVREPNGTFATWFSFFVPVTPMLMVLRMSAANIPLWQPILGIGLVLLLTLAALFAASRVFRIGMLTQGNAPKTRELLRWIVSG